MSRQIVSDVERALASLGSGAIGYRRFPSRIDLPEPQPANLQPSDVHSTSPAPGGEAAIYPLLMAVFPDGSFATGPHKAHDEVPAELVMEAAAVEAIKVHSLDVAPTQGVAAGPEPARNHLVDCDAGPAPATVTPVEPGHRSIRLSYMFDILRAGSSPSELTMSQVQAALRRI